MMSRDKLIEITDKIVRARDFRTFDAAVAEVEQAIAAAVEEERQEIIRLIAPHAFAHMPGANTLNDIIRQIHARSKSDEREAKK